MNNPENLFLNPENKEKNVDIRLSVCEFSEDYERNAFYNDAQVFSEKKDAMDSIKEIVIEHGVGEKSCGGITPVEFLEFIDTNFSKEFLLESLVSKIILRNDTNVFDNGNRMYFRKDILDKILENEDKESVLYKNIYRAESYATWKSIDEGGRFEGKYFSTPVVLFNQDYNSDLKEVDYLSSFDSEEKKRKYIMGNIAHEIGHHAFSFIIEDNPRFLEDWKKIVDDEGNVTDYANEYDQDDEKDYDENFAEALRLFKTSPEFFKEKKPKAYEFIFNFVENYNS